MKIKIPKTIMLFIPMTIGLIGGYLYYALIGCNGTCVISSSPINSSLYGFFAGLVLTDWKSFKLLFKKRGEEK